MTHDFQTQYQTVTCDGAFIIGFFKQFVIKQNYYKIQITGSFCDPE